MTRIVGRGLAAALALSLAGGAALGGAARAAGSGAVPDFTRIVKNNRDAVVNVSTTQQVSAEQRGIPRELLEQLPPGHPLKRFFKRFGGEGGGKPERGRTSLGSGFIISADGYVLTNAHVVAKADEITVKLHDNRQFDAKVVGMDKPTDVGLLKIDASGLPTVDIGDSDELRVGQWLLAIGSPFGLDYTATQGIVSALERSLPNDTYTPFIQTDVAVNPGNSGGPLFNGDGEVIGINSQIFSRTGGYMGLSFAVPINTAMDIVSQLKEDGTVERGYLGVSIQPVDRGLAESFGLDKPVGALVADVMADSPAKAAGLQSGDVILRFDGRKVSDASALPPMVGRVEPGKSAKVQILRGRRAPDTRGEGRQALGLPGALRAGQLRLGGAGTGRAQRERARAHRRRAREARPGEPRPAGRGRRLRSAGAGRHPCRGRAAADR
ncbi:MAG: Do family serine endopeptidase [Halofilum sp. (in: g-proteobacteria)]|nr:Do family serine endopeptidase [Halofilum sp. (in: g-proteobacteria)]